MDTPTRTIPLLILLAVPLAATAQQTMPGLDLSTPAAPRPAEKQAPPAKPRPAPSAEPGTALEKAVGVPGEADTALEDRVKAVQRKGFLKRGRFQLTAFASPSVNDAFYQKVGLGGQLAYNITDSFAVALRGTYWLSFKTQYVKQGAFAFQSQLLASQLDGTGMVDFLYTPVYGKFAWLGKDIIHFDAWVQVGAGAAWSATSGAPLDEGPHLAGDLGGGIRFYPSDWMAVELGLLGTFYADQKAPALPGTIQKVVAITLGFSFFLPTRFEYYYP